MPGHGRRQTSSPTSPRTGVAARVDDVHVLPERGEAERDRLDRLGDHRRQEAGADLGAAADVHDRRRAAADVLEEPAVRVGVPRLAGRAERLQRREVVVGSPCGISARTSVGERPSIVTRSDSTSFHSRSCGQSGAPSAKTTVAPSAPRADDRPRAHDPAHVGREVDAVALLDVGLVRGLARDRDEEAALDEQRALRLAGRARRVGEQVRRLGVDLDRRERARAAASRRSGHERVSRFHSITCSSACGPASSSVARISMRLPRRSDQSAQIATFACESSSRDAIAGAAKPEKIGTCTAPMCAHACAATATAGRHRHVDRDPVARADAELDERLGELRHLPRGLGVGERLARRRPRRARRAPRRPAASSAQRCRQTRATFTRPPLNQVAHSGPRDESTTDVQGCENSIPRSSTTAGQKRSGSSTEIRCSSA